MNLFSVARLSVRCCDSFASALFLLVIVALIGFITYIVVDNNSYYGTWTQVTDYYEKSDPNKFICRVESRIVIDDVDSIKYTSKVTKGDCAYSEIYARGIYTYDFDRIEAESKFCVYTTVEDSDEWLHSFYYFNDEIPSEQDFEKTIGDYLTFEFSMIMQDREYLFERGENNVDP